MKRKFLIGTILVIIIFLSFVIIRENAKKYNLEKNNNIKKYNFIK